MAAESWMPIPNLDGVYEANQDRQIRNARTGHIKAQIYDGHYLKFGVDYVLDGIRHRGWYRVHRAVAEAFIPNPENKETVNHINGDRTNNSVDNLEWATPKEQSVHAAEVLKRHCGEDNYNATLTNKQVKRMRRLHKKGVNAKELSVLYGKKVSDINRILSGERWKHI